jgi:hypothetical protein
MTFTELRIYIFLLTRLKQISMRTVAASAKVYFSCRFYEFNHNFN